MVKAGVKLCLYYGKFARVRGTCKLVKICKNWENHKNKENYKNGEFTFMEENPYIDHPFTRIF
jgi:phosphomevalonate kinase